MGLEGESPLFRSGPNSWQWRDPTVNLKIPNVLEQMFDLARRHRNIGVIYTWIEGGPGKDHSFELSGFGI